MMNDAPVVIQNYKVHTYIRTYAQREDEGGEREREREKREREREGRRCSTCRVEERTN